MPDFFCLIKFGEKEHLENLMNNGQMRFGAIQGFSTSTELERGDKFEGATSILNGKFSKIECDHPTLGRYTFSPAVNALGSITEFDTRPFFSFSTYALTSECFMENDLYRISNNMLAFGNYALVINEPILFLNKVKQKLINENNKFGYRLVSYHDYEKEGKIETDFFTKTDKLAHQNEHRILIENYSLANAIFIEIGSVREFCFLSTAEDIINTEFKAKRRNSVNNVT